MHIQDAEYWEFYDLELINGPYGVYSRDASNNHYERIVTRDNYETGKYDEVYVGWLLYG